LLQTTFRFPVGLRRPLLDNTNRKQRAAFNIDTLYMKWASNASLVSGNYRHR